MYIITSKSLPVTTMNIFKAGFSFAANVVIFLMMMSNMEAAVRLPKNVTVPAVIVFGDSIVDPGNNNYIETTIKCNFPPYGKDFAAGGMPTGRFSNGKTPADLIAEELGIKEYVPAYSDPLLLPTDLLTGVSFASGANGYDPQTSQLMSVLSLSDQLKMFKEYIEKLKAIVGEERTRFILSNSLFSVITGSDDLANTYFTIGTRRYQYDINSYTDLLVQWASEFIKELYELGARRISVFGAAPIGCLPSQRTLAGGVLRECSENYNQAAQLLNTKLSNELNSLNKTFNVEGGVKTGVVYIDIYTPLLDLIQNPEKYGFEVVDRGCCGTGTVEVTLLCNHLSDVCPDRSKYLFWDSYHPTEKGYRLLVGRILQTYIGKL